MLGLNLNEWRQHLYSLVLPLVVSWKKKKKKKACRLPFTFRFSSRRPSPPLAPPRQVSYLGNTRLLRSCVKASKTCWCDNRMPLQNKRAEPNQNLVFFFFFFFKRKMKHDSLVAWVYLNSWLIRLCQVKKKSPSVVLHTPNSSLHVRYQII